MPVPATSVNVSVAASATTLDWPATAIVLNAFWFASPLPPPPPESFANSRTVPEDGTFRTWPAEPILVGKLYAPLMSIVPVVRTPVDVVSNFLLLLWNSSTAPCFIAWNNVAPPAVCMVIFVPFVFKFRIPLPASSMIELVPLK